MRKARLLNPKTEGFHGKNAKCHRVIAEALVSIGLKLVVVGAEAQCLAQRCAKTCCNCKLTNVTLDWDLPNFSEKLLLLAKLDAQCCLWSVTLSPSGSGCHVEACVPKTSEDHVETRIQWGDDINRAVWDDLRERHLQEVLFEEKNERW